MKRILKMLAVFMITISCIVPGLGSYAKPSNEKIIQVPISKNYKSAKFTLTFDYYDDYIVVIKSPDKKEYKGTLISEKVVECVVNDIDIGQWEVVISLPQPEEDSEVTENESGDKIEEEQREISPVKVKLEGSTEELVDVSKDITVATDIAGLKMYFKDDDFIAEWTDTTCGNVNVEVVNAKNLQKIDTQTVKGKTYSCPLNDSIEEIMVTIVPAVSANVDGASKTFTFKFDNHPNATVTYEELGITNHDSLKVTAQLNDSYAVKILVNGKQTEYTQILSKGTYEYEAPIDVGLNDIVTYIVDKDGNMRSTMYSVEKDVVAPNLELVSSYQDIVTENEYLTIEGKVDDFNKLMINTAEVEVEGDNTFKYDYKLKEGINQIAVVASDLAGNETVYDIAIERVIPQEKPVPWTKIIICASLVGLLFIYVIEVIKRKRNPEKYRKEKEPKEYSEYDDIDISKLSQKEKKDILKGPHVIWEILSFAVPLLAAYIILTYVIMVSVVQSGSMEPKLGVGNTVFYNRLAYVNSEPQRGDVIVFFSEEYNSYFGKRVIGLPGDKITFKDGYVVINGQYCDESAYIDPEIETNCSKEFEVPSGCYFLLGDNRELSNDARFWNQPYIEKRLIAGKYMGQIEFSFQYDIIERFFGK